MSTDPYASCPCGSGKKFKWCCQEIHSEIDRAFEQHNSGQHEAALQTIARVVAAHPDSAEAWGGKLEILSLNEKPEEAEQSLDKAFAVNPSYPFGFLLRGLFRQQEGEVIGSLMLFRKASEAFAADAHDQLAYLNELIADTELRLNKPVAARAAILRAMAHEPGNAELRTAFEDDVRGGRAFAGCGSQRVLVPPPGQRRPRMGAGSRTRLVRPVDRRAQGSSSLGRQTHWRSGRVVQPGTGPRLARRQRPGGRSPCQVDRPRLGRGRATEAWRWPRSCAAGTAWSREADYVEHRVSFPMRDPQPVVNFLQQLEQSNQLIGVRSNPEAGMVTGLLLDEVPRIVLSGASAPPARLAAYVMVAGPVVQFWHPKVDSVEKVVAEAVQKIGPALGEPSRAVAPVQFGDVVADALLFPTAETTQFDAEAKIRTNAQNFFEETWVNQPLKSLLGKTPVDAAGNPVLRKRLRGVVQFVQDCAAAGPIRLYDFNRLRADSSSMVRLPRCLGRPSPRPAGSPMPISKPRSERPSGTTTMRRLARPHAS